MGIGVGLVLAYMGYLTYQFYTQIQDGTIDLSDYSTNQQSTLKNANGGKANASTIFHFEDDPSMGPEDAKLTIIAFEDFECPYCRQVFPALRSALAQHPEVRFIYRDFPLDDIHPNAQKAAEAGQCAHDQGKFWAYHDKLYTQQRLAVADLKSVARELNLNVQQFDNCLDTGKYTEEVQQDFDDGIAAGVGGTPTFFFNGNRLSGVISEEGFEQIIDYFEKK